MPDFEKFRADAALGDGPTVTVRKGGGSLLINASAFELLREPTHVELYFDRKERVVGIKGVDAAARDGLPVKVTKNQKAHVIAGRAFFKFFGITWYEAHHFRARMDGDILCIDLGDVGGGSSPTP